MITPTRTVCYAIPVNSNEGFVVNSARVNGVLIELQQRPMKLHYLPYSEVDHLIVREEPIEQYYPGMVCAGDFSDLKIEPGEIRRYPSKCSCQKGRMCRSCCLVLGSYAQATAWTLPSDEMFGRYKEPQA